jgi:glycosyltransferase involved in cell wall biosynthesis
MTEENQTKGKPQISILVCSLHSRKEKLKRLCDILKPQLEKYKDESEIIIGADSGQYSIGTKRNYLVHSANGEYVAFVDDDDTVSDTYIELLLEKIKLAPDIIVFDAFRYSNGKSDRIVKYGIEFKHDSNTSHTYFRIPNHLMCVKKSLAIQIPFKEVNFGEDADYAKRLLPLLKTQERITETLYNYLYNDK